MELGDEMREGLLRLGEAFRDLLEMRHVGQFLPRVGSLQFGVQLGKIGLAYLITNGLDIFFSEQGFLALHPILHLRGFLPIAVVLLQHFAEQVASLGVETLIVRHLVEVSACVFCGEDIDILIAFKCVIQDVENQRYQFTMLG